MSCLRTVRISTSHHPPPTWGGANGGDVGGTNKTFLFPLIWIYYTVKVNRFKNWYILRGEDGICSTHHILIKYTHKGVEIIIETGKQVMNAKRQYFFAPMHAWASLSLLAVDACLLQLRSAAGGLVVWIPTLFFPTHLSPLAFELYPSCAIHYIITAGHGREEREAHPWNKE